MDEDSSDWKDSAVETREWESRPKSLQDDYAAGDKDWDSGSDSDVDIYAGEEECIQEKWLKTDRDYEGDWEEEGDEEGEEEEEEWDSSVSTEYLRALQGVFPLLQKGQQPNSWGSEPELEYLRDGESESSSAGELILEQRDYRAFPVCHMFKGTLKGYVHLSVFYSLDILVCK